MSNWNLPDGCNDADVDKPSATWSSATALSASSTHRRGLDQLWIDATAEDDAPTGARSKRRNSHGSMTTRLRRSSRSKSATSAGIPTTRATFASIKMDHDR